LTVLASVQGDIRKPIRIAIRLEDVTHILKETVTVDINAKDLMGVIGQLDPTRGWGLGAVVLKLGLMRSPCDCTNWGTGAAWKALRLVTLGEGRMHTHPVFGASAIVPLRNPITLSFHIHHGFSCLTQLRTLRRFHYSKARQMQVQAKRLWQMRRLPDHRNHLGETLFISEEPRI